MEKTLVLKNLVSKKRYYLIYTLIFIVMALLVCSWFFFSGRSFIWGNASTQDGFTQHYTALIYWAEYLRSIIRTLFEQHTLIFPEWDFTIGEGSDILETLQYYVIGDPFAFFSVFVPTRFMYIYYDFMILLRLYLAGMAFSGFCFMTGQKSRYAVLAGSMTYVFCYWAMINIARHPYFLNPMLYLPLLLMGVEKILQGKRPYILIFSVFLSGISNFYFFYILTLLTLIYVVVRLIFVYRKNVKQILLMFLKIAIPAVVGILLAAIILLPMLRAFLGDARMTAGNAYHLFYPLSYYSALPSLFISPDYSYWLCMGFAAPVLPAVILLFRKRGKNTLQKIYFAICIVIILFPFFGQVFNGFSYQANRWCFAFSLLCSYILVQMWPELMKLKKKDAVILIISVMVYFVVCLWFDYSRQASTFVAIVLALFFLFLLYPANGGTGWFKQERKIQIALSVLLVSIFVNSFWFYSYGGSGYASESVEIKDIPDKLYTNETKAIEQVANNTEENFYRYSGEELTYNASVRAELPSTQFFWTISNPFVSQFRKDLSVEPYLVYRYSNYDERASLTTLASVLYYVVPEGYKTVPYGFSKVETVNVAEQNIEDIEEELKLELNEEELNDDQIKILEDTESENYVVYRNDNALPLAYTYDTALASGIYQTLSPTEKQEALLQEVVLEGDPVGTSDAALELTCESVAYTTDSENGGVYLSRDEDALVVTEKNATMKLSFEGLPNAETYILLEGLDYVWTPRYKLYFGDETVDPFNLYNKVNWDQLSYKERKTIRKERLFWREQTTTDITFKAPGQEDKVLDYGTDDYSYYNDRHDFAINIGYSEDGITEITITFAQIGVYNFDSLEVVCQPMDQYEAQVSALKEDTLDNLEIGTDIVSGTINLDRDKILCFSIPYSTGWTAIVDGEKAELYQANTMYMGLPLTAGYHTIQLVYHSPFLRAGAIISCITAVLLIVYAVLMRLYRKRNNRSKEISAHGEENENETFTDYSVL